MALSSQEIQEKLKSNTLTLGEALDYAEANTPAVGSTGKKSADHRAISALRGALSSGADPTGLTLESPYSLLNDDEVLRVFGGATDKSSANRLRSVQVVENTIRPQITNARVGDDYPLLIGGKDTQSRTKELGLQTQKRNKLPTEGLVTTEEADRIYYGDPNSEDPSRRAGALSQVDDPNVRGFLIYQRYTGARIESTIDANFGLKVGDISFTKDKEGNRVANIKAKTAGKKTRPAVQVNGAFAEFLFAEQQRAKAAGQTNIFETSKSKTDKAWNTHFRPIFEADHADALPVVKGEPKATPYYPRKLVSTILEEEVGAPKDLVSDWMGHSDGSTRAMSYTGGRGGKVEVGRLIDGMVRDSARIVEAEDTNAFFARLGVEIKSPLRSYDAFTTSFGYSTNPAEMPATSAPYTPMSEAEIEAARQTFIEEQTERQARAKVGTVDAKIELVQKESQLLEEQIRQAKEIQDNPELQRLLENNARLKNRLKLLEKGIDPDAVEEVPTVTFSEGVTERSNNLLARLKKLGAGVKIGKDTLQSVGTLGTVGIGASLFSRVSEGAEQIQSGEAVVPTVAQQAGKFVLEEGPVGTVQGALGIGEAAVGAAMQPVAEEYTEQRREAGIPEEDVTSQMSRIFGIQ